METTLIFGHWIDTSYIVLACHIGQILSMMLCSYGLYKIRREKYFKALFILFIVCIACALAQADTHTSVGDGNWSTAGTWDANAVPADGDAFVINHNVIFDANQNNASISC